MADCIFCKNLPKVLENDLVYALYDIKPFTKGHMLIIPKRHIEQLFELNEQESVALHDLIKKAKALLDQEHHPDGYNMLVNSGVVAGQVVMHAHVHLIPRYKGSEFKIPLH